MRKKLAVLLIVAFMAGQLMAQRDVRDTTVAAFIPYFSYAFQLPGGDIADRYGNNSTIGGGLFYKTRKNLLFSADVNFIFGSQIKIADTVLSMVETQDGHIIDGNGVYAQYALYERGYSINFRIGKIFTVLNPNPNSGILVMGGLGYLVHRLKIDNQYRTAPQISGDYAKGYDRLTGGITISEFVGYYFMGRKRVLNFYGGFEFYQAFTRSRRDYVFDQMKKDNNNYIDLFYGIKVGWMIPIYNRAPDKYYYH
ncbi:MAG: hypothetical protein GXO86_15595 [Chlorobi bacterium]|nr:hypothetical protein [Chlorobiota bacterium]